MVIPTNTVVIGLVGLAVLAFVWKQLGAHVRARRWKSTTATILESWLDDGGGNPRDRRVKVCARYRYHAGGITYVGERLGFTSPIHRHYETADRHVARLRPGKRIEIWYDPADPASAVVDRSIPQRHYLLAAAGMFCVAEMVVTAAVALIVG